ncbi:amino-acid N-acetyltransferase [Subtercola sp. PAMC28395]|uniref:amino-acid N-acetyltransferase n=1 Tax=Subtercola sp. PAMC28395 TaxID=2846775 RepID=UPI001C0E6F8A|nr:amino-acid N-acetyltransferase [Subtercola sp. PAMC28395]QWT24185.1 amino-acid N-acetyltransferase [Subtercola sp. PAMC28395]
MTAADVTAARPDSGAITVRRARTSDVPWIQRLVEPLVQERILLGKDSVVFYEAVQEFRIAVDEDGTPIGCGALHVFWEDLGEVRTLAVDRDWLGRGVGHALLNAIENDARELGLSRLFCLTFEVAFFERHDFVASPLALVAPDVYAELVRSPDEGVAEFLDLARVKPNTLGNTRMLKHL